MAFFQYQGERSELQGIGGQVFRLGAEMPENWTLYDDGTPLAGVRIADFAYADGGSGLIRADVAGDLVLGDGFNNHCIEITGDITSVAGRGGDLEIGSAWYGDVRVTGVIEDDLKREWDLFSRTEAVELGDLKLRGGQGGGAEIGQVRKSVAADGLYDYEIAIGDLGGRVDIDGGSYVDVAVDRSTASRWDIDGGEDVSIAIGADLVRARYDFDAGLGDATLRIDAAPEGSVVRTSADGLVAELADDNRDLFVFRGGTAVVDLGAATDGADTDRLVVTGGGAVGIFAASAERIVLKHDARVQIFDPDLDLAGLVIEDRLGGGRLGPEAFRVAGDSYVADYGENGTVTVFGNGIWNDVDDFTFI